MGAGESTGECNDDLVDTLKEAAYICSESVERAFRAVDRGHYCLSRTTVPGPYCDAAWKSGKYHLSAPCIYSMALEGLNLQPGLSFLNLGSGTGYLSTMAGLILGAHGVNHGIELHDEVVQYARQRLQQFKYFSGAVDQYDFCEPQFHQGNCLRLSNNYQQYDRVYCGASCTMEELDYIKSFVKVGGILIVPIDDKLMQHKRTSSSTWYGQPMLPVSFASLSPPMDDLSGEPKLPSFQPLTLQAVCRFSVRAILRTAIESEHPYLKELTQTRQNSKRSKKKRKNKKKKKLVKRRDASDSTTATTTASSSSNGNQSTAGGISVDNGIVVEQYLESTSESEMSDDTEHSDGGGGGGGGGERNDNVGNDPLRNVPNFLIYQVLKNGVNGCSSAISTSNRPKQNRPTTTLGSSSTGANTSHNSSSSGAKDGNEPNVDVDHDLDEEAHTINKERGAIRMDNANQDDDCDDDSSEGEDLSDANVVPMEEEHQNRKRVRCAAAPFGNANSASSSSDDDDDDDDDGDDSSVDDSSEKDSDTKNGNRPLDTAILNVMYKSPYTVHMKSRIRQLPLPTILKCHLNYGRPVTD